MEVTVPRHYEPPSGYRWANNGERTIRRLHPGDRRWFEYHCWEDERSADADLWRHTHQRVEVIRRLSPDEADMEIFEVRFEDGLVGKVFADELVRSRKHFTRPPYAGR